MLLTTNGFLKKSKIKSKKQTQDNWKWKHNAPKPMRQNKRSSNGEVHSNIGLRTEDKQTKKSQINKLTLSLEEWE